MKLHDLVQEAEPKACLLYYSCLAEDMKEVQDAQAVLETVGMTGRMAAADFAQGSFRDFVLVLVDEIAE